jgi:hypothetical protein
VIKFKDWYSKTENQQKITDAITVSYQAFMVVVQAGIFVIEKTYDLFDKLFSALEPWIEEAIKWWDEY